MISQNPETFTYDPDGNLTSDSLWTNIWNAENRRIVVQNRSTVPIASQVREDWTILPDGRWLARIVSTNNSSIFVPVQTNRFVWDGDVLLAVLNHTNGLELAFLRGLDLSGTMQDAGGVGGLLAIRVGPAGPIGLGNTVHFSAYDGNGNVTALVSATDGTESARYEYGPFAEPLRVTGDVACVNPIRFGTQYQDDVTGDSKYLFRDYTPSIGRWLSRDPINENGGANLNSFVNNAPLSSIDAFGEMAYLSFQEIIKTNMNCGNANWTIKWKVTENKTKNSKEAKSGFIYQKITQSGTIWVYNNFYGYNSLDELQLVPTVRYEGWFWPSLSPDGPIDPWINIASAPKGDTTIIGVAYYTTDKIDSQVWKPRTSIGTTDLEVAPQLNNQVVPPKVDSNIVTRTMKITWDCRKKICPGKLKIKSQLDTK
jgi:RHS repeat-associated protein